jgi:predicted AAA+ superfamily ATPase
LSTELSTLLTGRHLDLSVLPLTFKEFSELSEAKNYLENLDKYIAIGGLGVVIPNINRTEDAKLSLKGVLEDTINKDIKHRHKNTSNILINKVIEYAFNNVGVEISTVKLESYFKKTEKNYATYKTLNNYLQ